MKDLSKDKGKRIKDKFSRKDKGERMKDKLKNKRMKAKG